MEVIIGFLMILVIGSFSLIGVFMISIREKTLDRILFILVAFATGTILASALFDLIPESIHHLEELNSSGAAIAESLVFVFIIFGFVMFLEIALTICEPARYGLSTLQDMRVYVPLVMVQQPPWTLIVIFRSSIRSRIGVGMLISI